VILPATLGSKVSKSTKLNRNIIRVIYFTMFDMGFELTALSRGNLWVPTYLRKEGFPNLEEHRKDCIRSCCPRGYSRFQSMARTLPESLKDFRSGLR
jgi:hypothetical protein